MRGMRVWARLLGVERAIVEDAALLEASGTLVVRVRLRRRASGARSTASSWPRCPGRATGPATRGSSTTLSPGWRRIRRRARSGPSAGSPGGRSGRSSAGSSPTRRPPATRWPVYAGSGSTRSATAVASATSWSSSTTTRAVWCGRPMAAANGRWSASSTSWVPSARRPSPTCRPTPPSGSAGSSGGGRRALSCAPIRSMSWPGRPRPSTRSGGRSGTRPAGTVRRPSRRT